MDCGEIKTVCSGRLQSLVMRVCKDGSPRSKNPPAVVSGRGQGKANGGNSIRGASERSYEVGRSAATIPMGLIQVFHYDWARIEMRER